MLLRELSCVQSDFCEKSRNYEHRIKMLSMGLHAVIREEGLNLGGKLVSSLGG